MFAPGPPRSKGPNPLIFLGLGVQLAASVVIGVYAGQWLDRRVGIEGVFTALGALLGFAVTLYSLIRTLSRSREGG